MYESTSTQFQAEIDYRAARIKNTFGARRQPRWTRVRRSAGASSTR